MKDKLGQNILSIIKTWMEENQADWPNDFAFPNAQQMMGHLSLVETHLL